MYLTGRRILLAATLLGGVVLAGCSGTPLTPAPVEDRDTRGTPSRVDPATLPGFENAGKPGYYTVRPGDTTGARLVRGDTDHCVHEALAHMNLLADVKRRGLDWSFHSPGRPLRAGDESRGGDESGASTRARPAGGDGASGADAYDGANASKRHGATLHGGGAQGASVHVSAGDAASSYRAPAESAAGSDAMPRTDENTAGDASSTPTARKRREPPPEPFQIQPEDVPF